MAHNLGSKVILALFKAFAHFPTHKTANGNLLAYLCNLLVKQLLDGLFGIDNIALLKQTYFLIELIDSALYNLIYKLSLFALIERLRADYLLFFLNAGLRNLAAGDKKGLSGSIAML